VFLLLLATALISLEMFHQLHNSFLKEPYPTQEEAGMLTLLGPAEVKVDLADFDLK
jgi:hypothetical protein